MLIGNICNLLLQGNGAITRVLAKIVNEYDQEIPQSQLADNPVAP